MRNQDPNDLYKIVFGEFDVINTDNLKVVTKVIGWHCRVLKNDILFLSVKFHTIFVSDYRDDVEEIIIHIIFFCEREENYGKQNLDEIRSN